MERLILVRPSEHDKEACLDYRREFEEHQDIMHGTAGLAQADSFEAWLNKCRKSEHEETLKEDRVPATTFLAVTKDTNRLIGMTNIRHWLNDALTESGGHIGYSVRKSERQQGYAKEMLALALQFCKEQNISRVLMTCNQDNIASRKTIECNSGQFDRAFIHEGTMIEHYWIDLSKKYNEV